MASTIRMLIILIILCVPYLTSVECRFKGKVTYTYQPKICSDLNTLALIGTRDPPTFKPPLRVLPRLLPLTDKLKVGVRVLDMGVRRINDEFAMYNSSFDMRAQFKDLVGVVKTFLEKNPKEFVLMIMHAESTAINLKLSECEILRKKYIQKYPTLFVQNWSLDDTIGQHRGKILLLEKSSEFSTCTTNISCTVRDQQFVDEPDDEFELMDYVKRLQDEVRVQNSKCYLFYYTTRRDVHFPNQMTFDQRAMYIIRFNEAPRPQTINWIHEYFVNTQNSLYITVADLPVLSVIDKVIDSNT